VTQLLEVVEEQRADITPTIEWVPRWRWVIHLQTWFTSDIGLNN